MTPDVDAAEALSFSEVTEVGGMFTGTGATDGASSYFTGYVAYRMDRFHRVHLKSSIAQCTECCKILASPDLNLHLFTSFKEFKNSSDSSSGLRYCSDTFVETIIEFERVFLFFFKNYKHLVKFTRITRDFIDSNCQLPLLCCSDMSQFLTSFFVRCRTFQCIKVFNRQFLTKCPSDKVRKIVHC